MPELPMHMYKGRGNFSGPVTGGYVSFCFGPKSYTGTTCPVATTIEAPISFIAPCDFRLEKISYSTRSFTGTGATDTFLLNFYKGTAGLAAASLATDATALTASGTAGVTAKTATASSAYANYVGMDGTGIATFNATDSYRNVSKGEQVYVTFVGGVNAVAPLDTCVQFVGFVTGHPQTDSTKD